MKYPAILLTFLLVRPLVGAETNQLVPSDIYEVSHKSDYGIVTVRAGKLPGNSNWDTQKDPPLSLTEALTAARGRLPQVGKAEWHLSGIQLLNFGNNYGYGEWYYLVSFYNVTIMRKGEKFYSVIKHYRSVVFMDGTVLVPDSGDTNRDTTKPDVEPGAAPLPSAPQPGPLEGAR